MATPVAAAALSEPLVPPAASRARLGGVDAARAIAMLGVVHLHLGPFRGARWEGTVAGEASAVAGLLSRVAVPFFFVTAGHFFGRKLAAGHEPFAVFRRQASRLVVLYLVWSVAHVCEAALARGLSGGSLAAAAAGVVERVGWAAGCLCSSTRRRRPASPRSRACRAWRRSSPEAV